MRGYHGHMWSTMSKEWKTTFVTQSLADSRLDCSSWTSLRLFWLGESECESKFIPNPSLLRKGIRSTSLDRQTSDRKFSSYPRNSLIHFQLSIIALQAEQQDSLPHFINNDLYFYTCIPVYVSPIPPGILISQWQVKPLSCDPSRQKGFQRRPEAKAVVVLSCHILAYKFGGLQTALMASECLGCQLS